MNADQADEPRTVTLPAWVWRGILYAVERHADERHRAGQDEISAGYNAKAQALADALGVDSSGDLPLARGQHTMSEKESV
jgi:hypothetical protein